MWLLGRCCMKIDIKGWLKGILANGIRIGYSDGPAFDPHDQVRTDGMDDIIKNKEAKDGDNEDVGSMVEKAVRRVG